MDFAALAAGYDRLRPAGQAWQELADATLEAIGPARRLLDVGCGTGRFAVLARQRLGGRVWGVDPSPEMLAQARGRDAAGVGWKLAGAERLPFKDGWFDAVHAHLVLHLVDDLDLALAEMSRVLSDDGRAVVVSFQPEHFNRFHLNRYFPSIEAIDRARFPDPQRLCAGLAAAGLAEVTVRTVRQRLALEPDRVLERVRGRYISTLHLLDAAEYRDGLAQLEHDLRGRSQPLAAELIWALVTGRHQPAPG
jgi:ubiquinone/menaquinone biosynthesis C-methylase UbiE